MARESNQLSDQLDERLTPQHAGPFGEPLIVDETTPDERPTEVHRATPPQTVPPQGTEGQPAIVPVIAPAITPVNTHANLANPAHPANLSAAPDAPTYADMADLGDTSAAHGVAPSPPYAPHDVPHAPPASDAPEQRHQPVAQNPQSPPPASPAPVPAQGDARYTHVPWEAAASWGTSTLNGANTAAGMSYLFGWVSGLIVYFNERHNRYVRFHAVQSILWTGLLTIVSVVLYIAYQIFGDIATAAHQPWVAHVFQPLVFLGYLGVIGLWLWPMVAAWNGHYLRLPIIGEYAERYAAPPREPYPGPPPF